MKDIKGYEGMYAITPFGNVWSYKRKKFLNLRTDRFGYKQVMLSKDGTVRSFLVHRLVAEAYIPNPNSLPQVNHKDEVKDHNQIDNLEWCDAKYNIRYSKAIKVKCVETEEVFDSMTDAAKSINRSIPAIAQAVKNGYKCGGYHWVKID